MSEADENRERLSALEKALAILEVVAEQPQAVGLPDLTARLNIPRQTIHRVLRQLEMNDLVLRDPVRDRFSVGPRLSRLALAALRSGNQAAPVRAILQDLVDTVEETANVGVLDGLEFVYLERIECHWSLRVHLQAGSRVPAYCTSGGKVLLAHLDAAVRERLLSARKLKCYTERTLTRPGDLDAEFARIREQGYAINDQEYTVGIVGVAVPIADSDGRVLGALALHGPEPRFTLERAEQQVEELKRSAKRLADVWGLAPSGEDGAKGSRLAAE